jgi:hypothetical protein
MDPTTIFCPHLACPASGQVGQGHRGSHSRQAPRLICQPCHHTLAATPGTLFSRRRTSAARVVTVGTRRAPAGPLPVLGAACRLDVRPVAAGWARAGPQGQAIPAYVVEHPRKRGPVPADESRVKPHGDIGWRARALLGRSRVWLAGARRVQHARPLMRRLMARGRRGAAPGPRVCCTDGLGASRRAMRETCRDPVPTGRQGRPRRRRWRHPGLAQVVKLEAQRRIVDVARRLVAGLPAWVETRRHRSHGDGVLHTADSERRKAPCRARLVALTRRGRAWARRPRTLRHGRCRVGPVDNVCPLHARLGRGGRATTPAMAAGFTDHGWSGREVLSYHVPSPRWTPLKHRGRPSQALKHLMERWCGNHGELWSYRRFCSATLLRYFTRRMRMAVPCT